MHPTRSQRARRLCAGALVALVHTSADATAADLMVTIGGRTQALRTEALLAHPQAVTITVPQDVSYKRAMTYRAVPASVLLTGLGKDDSVRFVSADGFAAAIPADLLLAAGDNAARAYLAVEPPTAPWPPLKAGSAATAGPFYLVWLRPERNRIAAEQWPYQVTRIDTVPTVAIRFPALAPAATVSSTDPVRHGFQVFAQQCLPCHTLNLAGDAQIGPDLNVPFSPTEYMREDHLRQQVRNPQGLRIWKDSKMPSFNLNVLPDRDLDDLIVYLYYMAKRKVEVPKG